MNVTQELIAAAKRAKPDLGQNELAAFLGVSRQAMSNWVTGNREIADVTTIIQVCLAIGEKPGSWMERFATEQGAPKQVVRWWKSMKDLASVAILCVVLSTVSPAKAAVFKPEATTNVYYVICWCSVRSSGRAS